MRSTPSSPACAASAARSAASFECRGAFAEKKWALEPTTVNKRLTRASGWTCAFANPMTIFAYCTMIVSSASATISRISASVAVFCESAREMSGASVAVFCESARKLSSARIRSIAASLRYPACAFLRRPPLLFFESAAALPEIAAPAATGSGTDAAGFGATGNGSTSV